MEEETTHKQYIGDGLYVEFDGYQFRLWTPTGNEVFLDPEVLKTFIKFTQQYFKEL